MLLLINSGFIVLLLLSYLSSVINPLYFWPIAFLGIGYSLLLGFNILFVLIWLFKRSRHAIWSFLAIVLGIGTLKNHFGMNPGSRNSSVERVQDSSLRVLSYNVHLFRALDGKPAPVTRDSVVQLIRELNPDVVCLQEFFTRKKGEFDIAKKIPGELGLKYSYFQPVIQNEYEAYGMMILSRFPIQGTGVIKDRERQSSLNRMVYADIKTPTRAFRVYNVHLQSIGFTPEDYAYINKMNASNLDDDLKAGRRIGSKLKRAFHLRSIQASNLKRELERCRKPFVVTGDFNDTPASFAVQSIAGGLNNSFRQRAWGWGITYNGDFPNFQIDYILSSEDFSIMGYGIVKKKLSDHFPIWADISL